jgi:hypothetical protein
LLKTIKFHRTGSIVSYNQSITIVKEYEMPAKVKTEEKPRAMAKEQTSLKLPASCSPASGL